jgi:precorrin-6B methylase 2
MRTHNHSVKAVNRSCRLFAGLLLVPLLILQVAALAAQSGAPAIERPTELADPRDAGWFYRPDRADAEKPEALLDALGIRKGDVVADIGAGGGFFSLLAADRVGPGGRVLAVDVQPEMIAGLTRMMKQTGHDNIVPMLGTADDPGLMPDSVDRVLLVLTYHEFRHPAAMMRHIRRAMKPGARLLLVEYRSEDPDSRVTPLHKMSEADIMKEIPPFGFERAQIIDIVPSQHVFVFTKTAG